MDEKTEPQLGPIVIGLMRGTVYRDQHETIWQDLLTLQAQVIDYLMVIGLELELDESEGYAFLRQIDSKDDVGRETPRLIQRRPLSYPVSLLCVLLRKKLVEADAGGGDVRVILTREQIVEMVRVFLPDQANEARLVDRIDALINKVVELGFLRPHPQEGRIYEVRRIIKALVNADWLAQMDQLLKEYIDYAKEI
jgi:hypothetical protein